MELVVDRSTGAVGLRPRHDRGSGFSAKLDGVANQGGVPGDGSVRFPVGWVD
jgi:hypothetical protein